jgi:hypothetical protein
VPGVVVEIRDQNGASLTRAITSDRGQFSAALPARDRAARAHLVRIGYRPRDAALTSPANGVIQLNVTMTRLPTMLEPVVSSATNRCRVGPDAAITAALLEQARAGLLATVVVREANPAAVTRLVFERVIEGNGDSIVRQKVRKSTDERATGTFNASRSARDFVQQGFMQDSAGRQTFFGPDADVLLDPRFAAGYCFHVAKADGTRPNQIGLSFAANGRRDGRIDIDGTLWIDTAARALKDVEFRYVGFGNNVMEGFRPGGHASFKEVTAGIVVIDRWGLRMVGAADTTNYGTEGRRERPGFMVREVGGELARATWPDGRSWAASLGGVRLTAVNAQGKPAAGAVIALDSTDYRGTADATGNVLIQDLIPGPYSAVVLDPLLTPVGITLATPVQFAAARDSVKRFDLTVPTAEEYMTAACRAEGRPGDAMLLSRVTDSRGRAVEAANWTLSTLSNGSWRAVSRGGITGTTGLFVSCRGVARGETVQIQVARKDQATPDVVMRRMNERVNVVPIELRDVVATNARGGPTSVLRGTVTDSATGTVVAGAHVGLVGTPATAVTDSAGHFAIPGVRPGEYTVAIRTWSLDSLDAVSQSTVVFSDSAAAVQLHVPTLAQVANALCGQRTDGIIVGTVEMRGDSLLPNGVRVVAEWTELVARGDKNRQQLRWVEARTNARGTYRLCGVPLGTPVVLRAEFDSAGATPKDVRIADGSRVGRAEMMLDRQVRRGAVFTGFVMLDSTQAPLVDAEIALTTLAKSALTNEEGAFRITEVPPGEQQIQVKHLGYSSLTTQISFAANQTVDRRFTLGRTIALAPVITRESPLPARFEDHRRTGLGQFVGPEEIAKNEGRDLSAVLQGVRTLGLAQSGSRAYVIGKRVPPSLLPRTANGDRATCGGATTPCTFSKDDLAIQGYYCPTDAEAFAGLVCACYSPVYIDGALANPGRPTEPFDVNTIPTNTVLGIEYYGSASQIPAEYSRLNLNCGVLVVWTRRLGGSPETSQSQASR